MKDQDKSKQQLIEELAELRRTLEGLMNNLPEGVLIVDAPEVRVRSASQDACRTLGVSREEFEGVQGEDHFRYYQGFLPNGEPAKIEQLPLARVLFHGEVIRNEEWLFQVRDGRRIPVSCHAGPIRDAQGNITGGVLSWQDVTQRKQAEEALRRAHDDLEQRVKDRTAELREANERLWIFRQFAEASNQGFSMADLDGRLLYLNPALCRMLGIDGPEEYIGRHLSVCYTEEANRRGREEVEPGLKQHGRWEGELLVLSRQGTSIPTWHHAFTIHGENGKPDRLAVVITDIRERKQAESALQASEENLRTFFNTIEDLLFVVDRNGIILWVNNTTLKRLAYQPQELIGQNVLMVHPAHRRQEAADCFAALVARTADTCPVPLVTRHGRSIAVETRIVHGRWNGQDVLFGVSKDVSMQKASEERFVKAFQSNPLPMAITAAADGKLVDVNQAFVNTLGYDKHELVGQTTLRLNLFVDPGRQLKAFEIMEQQGSLRDFDADVRTKDGRIRHGVFAAETIELQDQRVLLSVMNDVTERKEAMEAVIRERQTLQHMLRASDHERQLIAYDIHDGLAQYLTGAMMQLDHAQSIREDRPEDALTAYKAGMELLRQSHFEARRLISGVRPPILDESGVAAAIAHLVYDVRAHKGPEVEFRSKIDFARLTPTLENSIYRIAQEGLTNACKHSRSKKVILGLVQRGDRVRIIVRDQGIGFDPKAIEEGHFGLEGIRERARLLGGKTIIDSKPGKGTRIMVDLPIVLRSEDQE